MEAVKQVYLLLICQGFYLGSGGQKWTFPDKIPALIGSCVEIPCTYDPAGISGTSSPVWYLYKASGYPEILNTKDSSSVMEEFKARTSLVPGDNSCALRIDPVRRGDAGKYYYPGIAENTYTNADDKQSRSVHLSATDKVNIWMDVSERLTEGEATTIRCSVIHTCRSSPPSLQWNKPGQVKNQSVEISGGYWKEESELTYIPSYEDDGSPVLCTAKFPNDLYVKDSGKLNINYAPKNVTVTVIDKGEVMEGSDVRLQCNSFSKPDVDEYEWYKGKTKLSLTGEKIRVINVTRDTEPYSCAARNAVGRGESALTEIPVLYAATGVHITVKNGRKFTVLTCDFLSSRPDVTHYTWMKDGSILHNETWKTLTIDTNEDGQYSCIAHNTAGNSSSEEIHMKHDAVDLPLILGTTAGVFFLILFILIIYFCLRRKKKSPLPTSPIHGTIPARIPYDNSTAKEEIQYGNIQRHHHTPPLNMSSGPTVNVNVEDNYVIYSNSEIMQLNDVEYSMISHGQEEQAGLTPSRANHTEVVDYATIKKH